MKADYTELEAGKPFPKDLSKRIEKGEVFAARGCLQRVGLLEEMRATSLAGIRRVAGDEVVANVEREGLEYIHCFTNLEQIAEITNAIYDLAGQKVKSWVSKIAPEVLNSDRSYYFERTPNIRFITPYDYMVEGLEALEEFARQHGGGKMTPHPPHRDSWVDCPDNVINVWMAIGPVPRGNGITIFPQAFGREYHRIPSGSIAYEENPGEPAYFDLEPGDAILFHGEHIHGTVLNHIETTRHVISFRITDGKPHYPNGHYHHYLHSSLADGPLDMFAELPANLSWSWVQTRLGWVAEKLKLKQPPSNPKDWKRHGVAGNGKSSFKLSSLPVDSVMPVTNKICVARIGQDKVVAFNRRCPHDGGDFAVGTVHDGKVICPWHNLPFDPDSGSSPCQSLKKLHFYETRVEEGTVSIVLDS